LFGALLRLLEGVLMAALVKRAILKPNKLPFLEGAVFTLVREEKDVLSKFTV
jgi:hypothetical protein